MRFEVNENHIQIIKTESDAQQIGIANLEFEQRRNDELERKMKALMKQLGITEL